MSLRVMAVCVCGVCACAWMYACVLSAILRDYYRIVVVEYQCLFGLALQTTMCAHTAYPLTTMPLT